MSRDVIELFLICLLPIRDCAVALPAITTPMTTAPMST